MNPLTEGDTATCKWAECALPIVVKRFHHVDGDDTLDWVHDDGRGLRNCPGWIPCAQPA